MGILKWIKSFFTGFCQCRGWYDYNGRKAINPNCPVHGNLRK